MADFEKQKCLLCGNTGLVFEHNLRDDNTHFAAACPMCGHVQVSPLPTIEEDEVFYQKDDMNRRLIPRSVMDDQKMMFKYEIWGDEQCSFYERLITPSPEKQRILEVGSGYGWFVEKMQEHGFKVDGIELSEEKRKMAKERSGLNLLETNLLVDKLPEELDEQYDVVVMFHVLEHISNPELFLSRAIRTLKRGGKLLVVVPNYYERMKQLSSTFCDFQYFRAHLSYFKPETLRFLFNKLNLRDIEMHGMQLYSFENAMWWLRNNKPFLEYSQIAVPDGLKWLNVAYKQSLEMCLESDGLIGIGIKN
jgi:2-polyprenyl-3-methyl-5-hydroxy-6-metoxy-1,4-benzoquinol methylase